MKPSLIEAVERVMRARELDVAADEFPGPIWPSNAALAFRMAARELDWPAIAADCRIADAARAYVAARDDSIAAVKSRGYEAAEVVEAQGIAFSALRDATKG